MYFGPSIDSSRGTTESRFRNGISNIFFYRIDVHSVSVVETITVSK